MPDDDLKIDSKQSDAEVSAPELPYRPPVPKSKDAGIGLIGCGGIASYHLEAYRDAGFNVVALCDIDETKALERRDEFYPDAAVCTDYSDVLNRDDVAVADIAVHPEIRVPMIEAALESGKHVLSQKPFVLNLADGERLASLADAKGLKLAVNQNGRWAPHFSYMRNAVRAGIIGNVMSAHLAVHWDHSWTAGTPFDDIPHMILYDFGIHWFDILNCIMGDAEPERVYASVGYAPGQQNKAPMLAEVSVTYPNAQATLVFDAAAPYGAVDRAYIAGTKGSLTSEGPDLSHQEVTLYTKAGIARPKLESEWFKAGFLGTMSELLCAIEENREPSHSARNNLKSLALCFAAMASADAKMPKKPGEVTSIAW